MFDLTTILNWLCWTFGVAIALLGSLLAARAFVGSRPRHARRCPRCWYDLAAIPTPTHETPATCPECARLITSERALTHRRRPRRLVVAGLIIALAGRTLWAIPDARAHGWPRLVPATAIALAAPALLPAWLDGPWWERGPIARRVARVAEDFLDRDEQGRLWRWQPEIFARTTAIGAQSLGRDGPGPDGAILDRLASSRLRADLKATPSQLYEAFGAATGVELLAPSRHPHDPSAPLVELRWHDTPALTAFAMIASGDYAEHRSLNNGVLALAGAVEIGGADHDSRNRVGVYRISAASLDHAALTRIITSVTPTEWVNNGGDRARLSLCGRWAIIDAPPSTLWSVQRLLLQLDDAHDGSAGTPAPLAAAREAFGKLASPRQPASEPLSTDLLTLAQTLEREGVPVSLDASAHHAARVETGASSNHPDADATAAEALDAIVATKHGTWIDLTWDLAGNGVVIVDKNLRPSLALTLAYNIADLIAVSSSTAASTTTETAEPPGSALLANIRERVDPEHWQEAGGDLGWMQEGGGLLVVHSTLRNHVAIDDLLTKARNAASTRPGL